MRFTVIFFDTSSSVAVIKIYVVGKRTEYRELHSLKHTLAVFRNEDTIDSQVLVINYETLGLEEYWFRGDLQFHFIFSTPLGFM